MAIGRVNTGGGGSGGTLTVTGVVGHTVTATKDGKTYTRTFNSNGVAVFKGLSTGTWTLTMTGDGQTATRTVDVTADYAVTITYFSATISITYPANSTCVVTNSSGQTVASDTNTGSSTKTWKATVGATGTYTVTATATDGIDKTKSVTVNITTDGQNESVTLSYELYIFKSGSGFVNGFSISGSGTVTADVFSQASGSQPRTTIVPDVNLSPYSQVVVDGKGINHQEYDHLTYLQVKSGDTVLAQVLIDAGRQERSIDISEINQVATLYLTGNTSGWEIYNLLLK